MKLKDYILIYDNNRFLYWGDSKYMENVTINRNVTIETFDTLAETVNRKNEIEKIMLSSEENPSKYYKDLKVVIHRLEKMSRKLYTNKQHYDNVGGDISGFDYHLMQIVNIINKDLIGWYSLDGFIEQ